MFFLIWWNCDDFRPFSLLDEVYFLIAEVRIVFIKFGIDFWIISFMGSVACCRRTAAMTVSNILRENYGIQYVHVQVTDWVVWLHISYVYKLVILMWFWTTLMMHLNKIESKYAMCAIGFGYWIIGSVH